MPDQLQGIVERMIAGGESEADIAAVIQHYTPPPAKAAPEGRSLGGFLENVATSGGRFLKDTASGLGDLAVLAKDAVQSQVDPAKRNEMYAKGAQLVENAPRIIGAAGSALKNRYGGMEQILNTLYTDPVGVASDVSSVLLPASMGAKAGGFAKTAAALAKASDVTNPMRAIGGVVEPLTHEVGNRIVRGTLRPPAAVREDFGGGRGVADAVLKDRVYSEASAGRKLDRSVTKADTMLADAQQAGTPGVARSKVARAVIGEPRDTAKLRTRLGVTDQSGELMDTAKAIIRKNPKDIPLTEAQTLKREAQALAYEAGTDNQTVKKAAEIAKAKALRAGIEERVPAVGPVNEQSQRLLGSKLAFGAAEDRPRALTNTLSILSGGAGFAGGGPAGGALMAALVKAADSPRAGALAGIGVDSFGKGMNAASLRKASLLARLLAEAEQ